MGAAEDGREVARDLSSGLDSGGDDVGDERITGEFVEVEPMMFSIVNPFLAFVDAGALFCGIDLAVVGWGDAGGDGDERGDDGGDDGMIGFLPDMFSTSVFSSWRI